MKYVYGFVWWLYDPLMWFHMIHLPIFFRVASQAPRQSYDCPFVSAVTLQEMGWLGTCVQLWLNWCICRLFFVLPRQFIRMRYGFIRNIGPILIELMHILSYQGSLIVELECIIYARYVHGGSGFELTKGVTYLSLSVELCIVFVTNWQHHIETRLHIDHGFNCGSKYMDWSWICVPFRLVIECFSVSPSISIPFT